MVTSTTHHSTSHEKREPKSEAYRKPLVVYILISNPRYKRLHNDETSKGDVSNAESEQHGTPHDVQLIQQENEHLKQRLVEVEKDKLERKEREEKLQADNTRLLEPICGIKRQSGFQPFNFIVLSRVYR